MIRETMISMKSFMFITSNLNQAPNKTNNDPPISYEFLGMHIDRLHIQRM